MKETPITSTPSVDGLFHVTDEAKTPPRCQTLFQQGKEDRPLRATGILKFVYEEVSYYGSQLHKGIGAGPFTPV